VLGEDKQAQELKSLGRQANINLSYAIQDPNRKTTCKTRIICGGQHVLRIDEEDRVLLSQSLQAQFLTRIKDQLAHFDGIIFSDYDKGFLGKDLIQIIIQIARRHHIPVMVDPKFQNFWYYEGATLFKPNLKELNQGLGEELAKNDRLGIKRAIKQMRNQMPHTHSLITLSEEGMLLLDEQATSHHLSAHRREIIDVSGAGDAVMAVVGLAIAGGFSPLEAAQLANKAGGLVCEEVGVVAIRPERLLEG